MRFIIADKKLLEQSKYYDKEKCWDYPLEEIDYVLHESNPNPDMIYVVCNEDKRLYETTCKKEQIEELFKELNQEPILRDFEMASLSLYVKQFSKNRFNDADKRLEKWVLENKEYNPNKKEILKQARMILEPLQRVKGIEHEIKNYIVFVLGYDLLNEELTTVPYPECDVAYNKCKNIAEDFLNSEYNVNTKSLYDCLVDYVEDRKYIKFIYEEDEETRGEEQ